MENSLERERRSKYDLIETADISYGHNKLLSYAICSLDCKNCNNYITTAYLPLRLKEEISCFNHFYKTQKHPAQTLWLPLPQYFSSTCLIRLPLWLTATFKEKKKKTIRRGSTVFLAMPKNLKMHCVSSILALLGGGAKNVLCLNCETWQYKCILKLRPSFKFRQGRHMAEECESHRR